MSSVSINELSCYQDIKGLIEQNNITICHTFWEENKCADFIGKLEALLNVDLLIHSSSLNDILNLLKVDTT